MGYVKVKTHKKNSICAGGANEYYMGREIESQPAEDIVVTVVEVMKVVMMVGVVHLVSVMGSESFGRL